MNNLSCCSAQFLRYTQVVSVKSLASSNKVSESLVTTWRAVDLPPIDKASVTLKDNEAPVASVLVSVRVGVSVAAILNRFFTYVVYTSYNHMIKAKFTKCDISLLLGTY